jgi:peptidoglycan/LPS O-acetylase OafA/YrhL
VTQSTGSYERFEALDGLRGIAALAVAFGHAVPGHHNTALAVDFFFILSGFVLTHSYAERLEKGLSFVQYMRARIVRLFPLVWLAMAIGFINHPYVPWGALLIPVPGNFMFPQVPPAWSLLFEMIASVLLGLGLWRKRRLLPLTVLGAVALAVAIFHAGRVDQGVMLAQFHYGLTRVLFGFGMGAVIYRFRPRFSLPPLVLCALLATILLQPWWPWYYQLAMALGACPLIIAAAANAPSFKGAKQLGELSYPLYILHAPIYVLAEALPPFARLALAVSVAWVALKLYDEPFRKWLSTRIARAVKSAAPAAPLFTSRP